MQKTELLHLAGQPEAHATSVDAETRMLRWMPHNSYEGYDMAERECLSGIGHIIPFRNN